MAKDGCSLDVQVSVSSAHNPIIVSRQTVPSKVNMLISRFTILFEKCMSADAERQRSAKCRMQRYLIGRRLRVLSGKNTTASLLPGDPTSLMVAEWDREPSKGVAR